MGIYEIQTGNPFYIGYRVYDTYVCEIYGRRGPEIAGVCLSVFISQLYILDRPMVTALLHNRRFLEFFSLFGSCNFWIESNRIRCGFAWSVRPKNGRRSALEISLENISWGKKSGFFSASDKDNTSDVASLLRTALHINKHKVNHTWWPMS